MATHSRCVLKEVSSTEQQWSILAICLCLWVVHCQPALPDRLRDTESEQMMSLPSVRAEEAARIRSSKIILKLCFFNQEKNGKKSSVQHNVRYRYSKK